MNARGIYIWGLHKLYTVYTATSKYISPTETLILPNSRYGHRATELGNKLSDLRKRTLPIMSVRKLLVINYAAALTCG